jgi:NusA-like KH domain protein
MGAKLDLDLIHSINLFSRITRVHTKCCFRYNNWLIFVVPQQMISKAIGAGGENVRQMSRMLKLKVKVIPSSTIEPFVKSIVYPIRFKRLSVENNEATIFAGPNSKASLIGRDKIRLHELERILKDYFSIRELKIV